MDKCDNCKHYDGSMMVSRCDKGHGGLFRLAVINDQASCPDYQRNPVITSIEVIDAPPPSGKDG